MKPIIQVLQHLQTDFFQSNKINFINTLEKQNKNLLRSKSHSNFSKTMTKFQFNPIKSINENTTEEKQE